MGKILIIDDQKAIRRALREILEFEDFQVEEAENGKEGFVVEAVSKMVRKRVNKRYRPLRRNLIKHKQNLMEDFEKMIHKIIEI